MIFVRVRLDKTVVHRIHCLDGIHFGNKLADNPHAVQRGLILQQVITTRRALYQVVPS